MRPTDIDLDFVKGAERCFDTAPELERARALGDRDRVFELFLAGAWLKMLLFSNGMAWDVAALVCRELGQRVGIVRDPWSEVERLQREVAAGKWSVGEGVIRA